MSLPFTQQEFLAVFAAYNQAVWPAQLALHLAAVASVAALALRGRLPSRLISATLALLWAWAGIVYHVGHFAAVNPAANLFAGLFVVGAAVFAWEGVVRSRLHFALSATPRAALGFALVAYALAGYPVLGVLLGHAYPSMPTFGAPCPTTLFTVGMLAFLRPRYPRYVFVFPLAWSLVALQAAFLLGMYEDLALAPAAAAAVWFALERPRKEHPA
jgi:hypothetical protein